MNDGNDPGDLPDEGVLKARFRLVLNLLLGTAGFYVAFYLFAYTQVPSWRLLYVAAVTAGLWGAFFVARRLAAAGRMVSSVLLVGYALTITAVVAVPAFAFLYPMLALMPLASGALVVGWLEGRALRRFFVVCGLASVAVGVTGALAPGETEFAPWVTLTILLGAFTAAVVIILILLLQSATHLHNTHARLRRADRFKDEFLSLLGHELRTPLASVSNASALLGEGDAADLALPALIDAEVRQMARLLDDLLDLTRIKQGKLSLQHTQVELGEVVAKVVEAGRTRLAAGALTLRFDRPDAAAWVEGDEVRLTQVVTNLLQNAIKYTPEGGTVTVSLEQRGASVRVSVADDGIGLCPALLKRVFEPFVQGPPVPGRMSEGLGLGLALVRHLVERQGGAIEAASDGPGRGARFTVTLPLVAHAPGPTAAPPAARELVHPGGRVLIVDDNRNAALTLALLVRTWGYEVRTALDAPAAIEEARVFEPQVVVLDLGLPTMDGAALGVELRREAGRAVALLAVTGYGREDHRARTREAGFLGHFVKPVDADAFGAALADAVRSVTGQPPSV